MYMVYQSTQNFTLISKMYNFVCLSCVFFELWPKEGPFFLILGKIEAQLRIDRVRSVTDTNHNPCFTSEPYSNPPNTEWDVVPSRDARTRWRARDVRPHPFSRVSAWRLTSAVVTWPEVSYYPVRQEKDHSEPSPSVNQGRIRIWFGVWADLCSGGILRLVSHSDMFGKVGLGA